MFCAKSLQIQTTLLCDRTLCDEYGKLFMLAIRMYFKTKHTSPRRSMLPWKQTLCHNGSRQHAACCRLYCRQCERLQNAGIYLTSLRNLYGRLTCHRQKLHVDCWRKSYCGESAASYRDRLLKYFVVLERATSGEKLVVQKLRPKHFLFLLLKITQLLRAAFYYHLTWMQRLLRAQKNIERFFADETPQPDRQQSR